MAVRTSHVFEFARKRAEQFAGVTPVKSALFSEDWVGFGIARLYESLMKETPIDARAFRDRATAAVWLGVPAEILKLEDKPAPPIRRHFDLVKKTNTGLLIVPADGPGRGMGRKSY